MLAPLVVFGAFTLATIAGESYTSRWDNVDIDKILRNERLLRTYFRCVMDQGKCSADAAELKKIIPEALGTNCAKCTEKQKEKVDSVMKYLYEKKQDMFTQLEKKYDPEGVFRRSLKDGTGTASAGGGKVEEEAGTKNNTEDAGEKTTTMEEVGKRKESMKEFMEKAGDSEKPAGMEKRTGLVKEKTESVNGLVEQELEKPEHAEKPAKTENTTESEKQEAEKTEDSDKKTTKTENATEPVKNEPEETKQSMEKEEKLINEKKENAADLTKEVVEELVKPPETEKQKTQ